MDKYRQIAELIKGFQRTGNVFFPATVESVEGVTCTVKVNNLSISDVKLKPTTDETNETLLLTPAIGSNVMVGSLSGDFDSLFILHSDSLGEFFLKVGEISFKLDKNGIEINEGKNKGLVKIESLIRWMQKVYSDLQTLKSLLATSPGKPAGTPLGIVFNPSAPNPNINDFEDTKVTH